jgi:parvulin-like peptidyl-prolyl isomerase
MEKNKHHFAAKEESVRVRHILVQIDKNASDEEKMALGKK